MQRETLLFGSLLAVAALYAASRTQRGQVAAVDAVEFVTVTAQRIADEAWRVSRGLRNRNPGNIDYLPPLRAWRGQLGKEPDSPATYGNGRFGVYDTDQSGVRAIAQELLKDFRAGIDSVRELIYSWAPPNENDSAAYASKVAKAVGVGASDRIDVHARLPDLVAAIIKHENGVQPYAMQDLQRWVYS